jgi:hypothetical protein
VEFEVLTLMLLNNEVFWDVTMCCCVVGQIFFLCRSDMAQHAKRLEGIVMCFIKILVCCVLCVCVCESNENFKSAKSLRPYCLLL